LSVVSESESRRCRECDEPIAPGEAVHGGAGEPFCSSCAILRVFGPRGSMPGYRLQLIALKLNEPEPGD
jgi:hypothetical protein